MSISVLIASHRKDQLLLLGRFLLQRGVDATVCIGGSRACAAVLERSEAGAPFDLVIAEVDLPKVPGLRVLYEARRLHLETVAAVICSSLRRADHKVDTMIRKAGAAVLMLPIDLAQVDALLDTARERRRLAGIGAGGPPVARPLRGQPAVARRALDIDPVMELSPEEIEDGDGEVLELSPEEIEGGGGDEVEAPHRHVSLSELAVAGYFTHGSGVFDGDETTSTEKR